MAALAKSVFVKDEDDNVVWFHPGDKVPAWAAAQITNPSAWAEAPAAVEAEADDAPAKPARRARTATPKE